MRDSFAPACHLQPVRRRTALRLIGGALAPLAMPGLLHAEAVGTGRRDITVGLTPVVLNDDLELLAALKTYLETSTGQPVKLILKRTYQDITTLLLSGQLDAAWICGYPFVAFRDRLELLAAPVWRGQPLYQSYIIAGADSAAEELGDLHGGVHAFSDPNSNSGFLVTAALLAEQGLRPEGVFSRVFFTYGHRNVVRAVAAGLAQSGSVDGYVWELLAEAEPEMTRMTRVVRKSELLGFPPIAVARGALARVEILAIQRAFIEMAARSEGRRVLELLRLDGFVQVSPDLFDAIAAKADLVKRLG
jgi:phosphonate transport system substrate-binding protein